MRRNGLWGLGLAILIASPAVAAPPFGNFDGIETGGNVGSRLVPLVGWALHSAGIEYVDIYVGERLVGRADYGFASPGVAEAFPAVPGSDLARWHLEVDSTEFGNDVYQLHAFVRASNGEAAWHDGPVVELFNTSADLTPFGDIRNPLPNTELFGVCDPNDPIRRHTVVDGYAVDAGLSQVDTGIKWVQLLLNGTLLYDTKRDCEYIPVLGGLTNCYGLPDQVSEHRYPGLPDAPHARFRFILDIGHLVAAGYSQGHHRLEVRAGDNDDQVAIFGTRTVVFLCDDFIGNEGAFGYVNRPQVPALSSDTILVRGWALDWEGIAAIRILVDGVQVGTTFPNEPRPLVTNLNPGYPNAALPGWSFPIDTTNFSNGRHYIQAVVVDLATPPRETIIGERFFDIQNPVP